MNVEIGNDLEGLKNYLRQMVNFRRQFDSQFPDLPYNCMEDFVLQEGREFIAAKRPKGVRKQRDKLCYQNSLHLMLSNLELIYVEGYAIHLGIPVHHAWCVTPDGVVVDPTWKHPEKGVYIGVPFAWDYISHVITTTGTYGVMENWKEDWPLLSGKVSREIYWDKRLA